MPRLDEPMLARAVAELTRRDADLQAIVARFGPPPLWPRPEGFGTLLHIVLEQQVSLASAQAAFDRLVAAVDPLTPDRFLALSDAELLAVGFSRQKAGYGRALAAALIAGELDLDAVAQLSDGEAYVRLVAMPGIGPWTATIYLLMALRRPDVWPIGDMALARAVAEVKGLERPPDPAGMATVAEGWRPWRAVAARLLWHDYLARRRRR